MKKQSLKRSITVILLIFVLFLTSIVAIWVRPILRQEENSVQVLKGIVQLNLKDLDFYEYDSNPIYMYTQYITKSKNGFEVIRESLEDEGWIFKEQFGSGYLFKYSTNEKEDISISSVQFTRFFKLWNIPMNAF